VKDLWSVRKFLGMRAQVEDDGYTLDQETLIREYLETHKMTNANPVSTPTILHQGNEDEGLLDNA
jgi:hypothetical protein